MSCSLARHIQPQSHLGRVHYDPWIDIICNSTCFFIRGQQASKLAAQQLQPPRI